MCSNHLHLCKVVARILKQDAATRVSVPVLIESQLTLLAGPQPSSMATH